MISSAVSSSPVLQIAGTVNTGTAGTLNSVADVWSIQNVLGSVAPNPTSTLTFPHSGTGGVAAVSVPSLVVGATAVPSTISTSGNHLTFTGSSGWFFSTTTTGGQLQRISGVGVSYKLVMPTIV